MAYGTNLVIKVMDLPPWNMAKELPKHKHRADIKYKTIYNKILLRKLFNDLLLI